MTIRKFVALFLCVLLLICCLGACGAEAPMEDADAKGEGYYAYNRNDLVTESTMAAADAEGIVSTNQSGQAAPATNQKLIRTVNLDVETDKLDDLLTDVEARIAQLNGYVESRNVYNGKKGTLRNRSAEITIRIPAASLDQFVTQVSGISNVVSHSEKTKDVTLSYVASESRVKALETEEARLLELVTQAGSLEDLLTLEARLSDIRAELEQHKSQLRLYDNQVSYSTIYLSVREVVEFTVVEEPEPEPGYWKRLGNGFLWSIAAVWNILKELSIFFVSAIPFLIPPALIAGIVAGVIVFIVKRRR